MLLLSDQDGPLYLSIYRQLREQIQSGQLAAGTRLPSKRALANELQVSINTIDGAYGQLQSEGFVESRPRSGYYVLGIESVQNLSLPHRSVAASPPRSQTPVIDFHPGGVSKEKFPFSVWQRLLRIALSEPDALRRTEAQGDLDFGRPWPTISTPPVASAAP